MTAVGIWEIFLAISPCVCRKRPVSGAGSGVEGGPLLNLGSEVLSWTLPSLRKVRSWLNQRVGEPVTAPSAFSLSLYCCFRGPQNLIFMSQFQRWIVQFENFVRDTTGTSIRFFCYFMGRSICVFSPYILKGSQTELSPHSLAIYSSLGRSPVSVLIQGLLG